MNFAADTLAKQNCLLPVSLNLACAASTRAKRQERLCILYNVCGGLLNVLADSINPVFFYKSVCGL